MAEIKYVQLEPAAFLSDSDYQMMTAEQRGVYCSIILYLYANGGKLQLAEEPPLLFSPNNVISLLSNCTKIGEEWEKVWAVVEKKFIIKKRVLTHKRVTQELRKARNFHKQKSLAGKKGMKQRYSSVTNDDITKVSKGKVSKGNNIKEIYKEKYLEFVFLSEAEHKKLIEKFGVSGSQDRIENLNNYIGSKGYKYKSHYHTILSWDRKNERTPIQTNQRQPQNSRAGGHYGGNFAGRIR